MKKLEKIKYIFLITMTFVVACIETDIYLPSFPDMMRYFHTTEAMIQSLLSWNFIGICISGPFYGPLSDSFGRKKMLMLALTLFLIGSIGTIFSNTIESMLVWRVFQGLGAGGCFTLGTTIIYDSFHDSEATKVINDLNCVVPLIMAAAPMLGGYLNLHYGFRANFIVIAIFVLISFLVCLFMLKESLPEEKRVPLQLTKILGDFQTAMKSFEFWMPTIVVALIFSGYLSYVSYSSILFVTKLGMTPQIFPYYQASVLLAFVSASLSANKMISAFGVKTLKKWGLVLLCLGGLSFMTSAFLDPNNYNLFHMGMMVYSFGAGWLIGPYFTESMEALPEIKGVTASLITSFRLLFTAGVIGAASHMFDGTVIPLATVFVVLFVIGVTVTLLHER